MKAQAKKILTDLADEYKANPDAMEIHVAEITKQISEKDIKLNQLRQYQSLSRKSVL